MFGLGFGDFSVEGSRGLGFRWFSGLGLGLSTLPRIHIELQKGPHDGKGRTFALGKLLAGSYQ